ncbi:MAG: gliding motility-associated C-terminal domain-containing protein [Saprospiraceae bacterium]
MRISYKKYLKGFILIVLNFILFNMSFSQVVPVVNVSFDSCGIQDTGSLGATLEASGDIGCYCGLVGNSAEFDGIVDGLNFGYEVNPLFDTDFTIEFIILHTIILDLVDLLTYSNECLTDSFFTLQYIPTISDLRLIVKETETRLVQIDMNIDDSRCWHHVAIIRDGYNYYLMVDGVLSDPANAERLFTFPENNVLTVSNNFCTQENRGNHHRFKGFIDEFKIYNFALNILQLNRMALSADMIVNQDTTIFLGDGILIDMGPTCADYFSWTGKADMDDPESLTPYITPKETSVYNLYITMNGKTCSDSIKIYIQDPDELDCKNILLPNSFTPNDDGVNDTYGISNKFIVEDLKYFDIYDKWGTRVFRTTNINDSWDGSYNNENLNPDKFIYKISYVCKNKEYFSQGIINLLR